MRVFYAIYFGRLVHGWGLDPSCRTTIELENSIRAGMNYAFTWAASASYELRSKPIRPEIFEVFKILINDHPAIIEDVISRFDGVLRMKPYTDTPTSGDVKVYCDLSRLEPSFHPDTGAIQGVRDPHRKQVYRYVPDSSMYECTNSRKIMAMTASFGKPLPEPTFESLQLCPWYVNELKLRGFFISDGEIARVALSETGAILNPLPGQPNPPKPIDVVAFHVETTLLHELTHTSAAGYGTDICYKWDNCKSLRSPTNSDSLALLGLATELILHRGYSVNYDGFLVNLEDKANSKRSLNSQNTTGTE